MNQEAGCGYCYTCQQCYSCQAGIADGQPRPVIGFGPPCHPQPQGPPQPGQHMPRPLFAGDLADEMVRLLREMVHLLRKLARESES